MTVMKLPDPYIEELIKELIGSDALPLVTLIKGKQNVSEFKIASKLNVTVNQVRNIFYRLGEHDLVSFTRKKDKQKGWYVYFWTFELGKAHHLLMDLKRKKIDLITKMLSEERKNVFLVCPKGCIRVGTEDALELQFHCPECNNVLKEVNKEKRLHLMEEQKKKLQGELGELITFIPIIKKVEVPVKPSKPAVKAKVISRKKLHVHPSPKKKSFPRHLPKKKRFPSKNTPSKPHTVKQISRKPLPAPQKAKLKLVPLPPLKEEKKVGLFGKMKSKLFRRP